MRTVWIAVPIVISSLLPSGCGTIVNLRSGDPEVYGGVAKDVEFVMTPQALGGEGGSGGLGVLMLMAGEVGLSLVGDTLTLPVVIRKKRIDDGSMDQNTSAPGETERPHVLRQFRRRTRRLALSEKGETAGTEKENVSLGKPQPVDLPAQSQTDFAQPAGTR
jgi:uncharacterized protein YceK